MEANELDEYLNAQLGPTESKVEVDQKFATSNIFANVHSASRGSSPARRLLVWRRSLGKENPPNEETGLSSVFKNSLIQEQKQKQEERKEGRNNAA